MERDAMTTKKTASQLDAEIAEYLEEAVYKNPEAFPGEAPVVLARRARNKGRAPKVPASPKPTGDTTITLPSSTGSGYGYTLTLRPAKVKTSYGPYGHGPEKQTAYPAKRSDDQWFVLSKSGMYIGVLEEGSGDEPWCVTKLEREAGAIGPDGIGLRGGIRCAATWQEALARMWG